MSSNSCTPGNSRGVPTPRHYAEPYRGRGKSVTEAVNEAYDKAMAPWKLLNGLGRGVGARNTIRRPSPQQPWLR